MEEKLKELKHKRELEEKLISKKKELLEKLESENEVFKELEETKQERIQLEEDIRKEAVEKFKETGDKKFGQIGIRITKKYDYDPETALNWAKEHNLCLSLDKTLFNKQIKIQPLDFVTEEEIPTATIPTKIEVQNE